LVRLPRVLTIAGSDSGGGAGIQADLKTFAALGVHGMTAITAITAQNTLGVRRIQAVEAEMVREQIEAVAEDIGVDAAKTGMLYTSAIIEVVADETERRGFPLVVDPVMIAKGGARLLKPEAEKVLVERLLPLATVVTPNALEAEVISGVRVETLEDGRRAAERIAALGPEAVVVKGGHIETEGRSIDILLWRGEFTVLEAERLEKRTTHGTGCSFSAAIAAELAKGRAISEAVRTAKELVNMAIRYGLEIGGGYGPLNPLVHLYNEAERFMVLRNVAEAVSLLESHPEVARLVPEVQMNLGMALPYAQGHRDVAAIRGRIVKMDGGVRASGCPEFGVSRHVARTIVTAMRFDPERRAGMNIRYSEETVKICRELGLSISFYDRREEPQEVKEQEGMTTIWGIEQAVKRLGELPDIIYHLGDIGKEPMIIILGKTAVEVAKRAIKIAQMIHTPQ
jgi:hydroxymethylpyrimidine/phosphomethylpyrimidine kinase